MTSGWTKDKESILISFYAENEGLWNPKHNEYKKHSKNVKLLQLRSALNNEFEGKK